MIWGQATYIFWAQNLTEEGTIARIPKTRSRDKRESFGNWLV
jgi:hypothetical protein